MHIKWWLHSDVNNGRSSDMSDHFETLAGQIKAKTREMSEQNNWPVNKNFWQTSFDKTQNQRKSLNTILQHRAVVCWCVAILFRDDETN